MALTYRFAKASTVSDSDNDLIGAMVSESKDIEGRVRIRAEAGEFFEQLLLLSRGNSADIHEDFIRELTDLSVRLRHLLEKENFISRVEGPASEFWRTAHGKRVAFIDGGVARIDVPSAAPMGIRVGSYAVRPGDESEAREKFNIELSLVDELYSTEGSTYEDVFDDLPKLTDAARIAAEASASCRMAKRETDLHAVFLHGPLVNPVAPYGTPGFPAFTEDTARTLLDSQNETFTKSDDRHFIQVYRGILERIALLTTPVMGVVERPMGRSAMLIRGYLESLQSKNRLSIQVKNDILDEIEEYRHTDASLLSVILSGGEYTTPHPIKRQEPENKWPDYWRGAIRRYPDVLTSYMKSNESSEPFRLELLEPHTDRKFAFEMIMHTARLLPNYGFPVGLDIADKYAKVPAWMSHGIRSQHAVILLKHALKSGNQKTIDYAKRVLTARGRDWLFRPKA